jgi:hypothetical protein
MRAGRCRDITKSTTPRAGWCCIRPLFLSLPPRTAWRFLEFFTVNIRNKNIRGLRAGGGGVPALVRG